MGFRGCLSAAGASAEPTDDPAPRGVTFNREIAPILFENCAACHRPGESAPFSLLSYQDAKKRAKQIAEVTHSRTMPPWLPEPVSGEFVGERRLSEEQVELIRRWSESGTVEGDPADLSPQPKFTDGWQLGEPDLTIVMPQSYTLAADGPDVFRNFAIPIPTFTRRFVKAVEVRPGNPKIVHHADLWIDASSITRRLDAQDPEPGFQGMTNDLNLEATSGHMLGWTPGQTPYVEPDGLAWPLEKGSTLALALHLLPSGKPEKIQSVVGFFFTDEPPTHIPYLMRLGSQSIDIAADEPRATITDDYVLPVDVTVSAIYPHAHYLGKEMKAKATLPDGAIRPLIHIKDWDFNWQDQYRYAKPFALPKGTTLSMQYTYDNTAANVRNPNSPPQRVMFGPRSTDEMGDLWLQVLTRDPADRATLDRDFTPRRMLAELVGDEMVLAAKPGDPITHARLAVRYRALGDLDAAIRHNRAALDLDPDFAEAHNNLALALQIRGDIEDALFHYYEAIRHKPDYADAHAKLALLLQSQDRIDEAIRHYLQALQADPHNAGAHNNLGTIFGLRGEVDKAFKHYHQALQINPDSANVHNNMGWVLRSQGKTEQAIRHYRKAIKAEPDYLQAHINLADAFDATDRSGAALEHFQQALRLDPNHVDALNSAAWILATHPDPGLRRPAEAIRLATRAAQLTQQQAPDILDTLGAAYAAAGQFDRAIEMAQSALALTTAAQADELTQPIHERLALYSQFKPYIGKQYPEGP